jgi:predicted transcriptional regulator
MDASQLTVRDVMETRFVSLRKDMDIYEAIELIIDKGLMGAPVVENNVIVGVFSEKDCFRVLSNWTFQMSNPTGGTVEHYMTREILTVDAGTSLASVVSKFLSQFYRGLPVEENGQLVGLISRRDILKTMMRIENDKRTAQYPDSKYGSQLPELG